MTADSAPPHLDAWWPRVLNGVRAAALAVRVTAPRRRGIAARTMLCIGLPLAIGFVTGHVEEGAAAAFGGLAGFSARNRRIAIGLGWSRVSAPQRHRRSGRPAHVADSRHDPPVRRPRASAATERLVEQVAAASMPTEFGTFRAVAYRSTLDGSDTWRW